MFGHASPLATVRLAGCMLACKRHAKFESSEALAEQPAGSGVHSRGAAWMLRQGVACRGAPQPTQHVDCVTRAGSPSAESRSRARSLVLLTMLAPARRREPHGSRIS
jgi:hypothetical protein